jgi:hypothetical protein
MPLLRGGLAFVYRAEIVVREIPDALDLAAALSSCGTATPGDDFSASPGSAHAARVTRHATPGHASRVTHHASRLTPHAALAAAARLIRRAHDAGLLHPDLNARNILLCPDGSAMVLDLDRAELLDELSLSDRFAALARLYRSLHKLGLAPDPVSDADWAIFYDAYAGDDPLLLGHTDAFLARCRRHLRRHQLWWRVTSICSGGRKG